MILANVLKKRRAELGYTLLEIATKMEVSEATVQRWESGNIKTLRYDRITKLAEILKVQPTDIMGWSDEESPKLKNPTPTTDTVRLPVLGNIAAGYEEFAMEDWSGETVEVPSSYLKGRKINDFIVLKVHGDSMYPEYHDGDKVVILKQNNLDRSGSVCAVLYNDEMATLKRVDLINDKIKLTPLNHNYAPKIISGEEKEHFRIIGIPKILIREIED